MSKSTILQNRFFFPKISGPKLIKITNKGKKTYYQQIGLSSNRFENIFFKFPKKKKICLQPRSIKQSNMKATVTPSQGAQIAGL